MKTLPIQNRIYFTDGNWLYYYDKRRKKYNEISNYDDYKKIYLEALKESEVKNEFISYP